MHVQMFLVELGNEVRPNVALELGKSVCTLIKPFVKLKEHLTHEYRIRFLLLSLSEDYFW